MGQGINLAKEINPELAQAIDNMKDQLLIAFVNRMGGEVSMPVVEIDGTGQYMMEMEVIGQGFVFRTKKKD